VASETYGNFLPDGKMRALAQWVFDGSEYVAS
jgi:hypothetical protein